MTPLLTIPFMILLKVSYVKGITLLIAQALAVYTVYILTIH